MPTEKKVGSNKSLFEDKARQMTDEELQLAVLKYTEECKTVEDKKTVLVDELIARIRVNGPEILTLVKATKDKRAELMVHRMDATQRKNIVAYIESKLDDKSDPYLAKIVNFTIANAVLTSEEVEKLTTYKSIRPTFKPIDEE